MQCRNIRFNDIAWHNDALVDVDWIVDPINQSDFWQQIMDKIADIIKKAQKGVCKSNLLQPRQDFDILCKYEMPHFSPLDIVIGPMQRLKRSNSELYSRFTTKDHIDSLINSLNMSCKMKDDILDGICSFGLIFFDNLSKVKLNGDSMLLSETLSA